MNPPFGEYIIVRDDPRYAEYKAFVPRQLPPEIKYSDRLVTKLGDARSALRGLSEVGTNLPNANLLILPYLRREAELSSKIEGTQASLDDLYLFDVDMPTSAPQADVKEVRNYLEALFYGLESDLPISIRLIKELHKILLAGVRGEKEQPGEIRATQNCIASKRVQSFGDEAVIYVPPTPLHVLPLLQDWEQFYHSNTSLPPLLKIALTHYQFEAIHPFGDGNGRIGRLLIILMMKDLLLLSVPLLYVSAYFEKNKSSYYQLLRAITEEQRWNEWLDFFLVAVIEQAEDAVKRSRNILKLHSEYAEIIKSRQRSISPLKMLDSVFKSPYIDSRKVIEDLRVTSATANTYLQLFVDLNILEEITGNFHHKKYRANQLMALLRS